MHECMVIVRSYLFTSRRKKNIAKFEEEVEVVDPGYQVQENFEQGKLPSILQLCYYFSNSFYTQWFWKNN